MTVTDLSGLFHYHFMQNAFLAGTVIAVVAGVAGYFMVLRSQSFAGHSLANVGFAGATGAPLLGVHPLLGLFVAGVLAAAGIHALGVGTRQVRHNDVAVGAVFTVALALGYLFVFLAPTQSLGNVYDVLFGNILGISDSDVLTTSISAGLLLVLLSAAARPLLFASVDPDVAAARGVPVRAVGLGFLVLLALVVAVAVQAVGVLLIFALLVTPAATARRLSSRPLATVAIAVLLAVAFTWAGLVAGYYTPYPVSFYITTFAFGSYVAVRAGSALAARRKTYRPEKARA
jgi:zinc/manganese transport system permease protein